MQATIKTKSTDMLLILAASMLMAVSVQHLSAPRYMPTSKIEEGEVVVRNDSVITVVIPDRR